MSNTTNLHFKFAVSIAAILQSVCPLTAEQSSSKNYKLAGQAAAPTPVFALPATIADVNGTPIPAQAFWVRLMNEGGRQVLSSMVDDILIDQEGRNTFSKGQLGDIEAEGQKILADFKNQFQDEKTFQAQLQNSGVSLEDVKTKIRRDIFKQRLMKDRIKVAQSDINQYFEKNKAVLAEPEKVHLRHILVASEKEAKDFLFALSVGANFELLAKEKSLDSATKDRGGDLGIFPRGMLLPAIEAKAFSLPVGVCDIVQSPMGFHIIKVTDKVAAKEASIDKKTRDMIEKNVRQTKFNQAYPAYVQKLREKSKIAVHLEP